MPVLEVYFDYACPYCYRAHRVLEELLPTYPGVAVSWNPCEAHPRPERYGPHSDLCIRGMYHAQAYGIPLAQYHAAVYAAIHERGVDVEQPAKLAETLAGLMEPAPFLAALKDGAYAEALERANERAYAHAGVWVVPAYRMQGMALDATEDTDITRSQLQAFLNRAAAC